MIPEQIQKHLYSTINMKKKNTQPRIIYVIQRFKLYETITFVFIVSQSVSELCINPEDFIHFEHLNRV